MGFSSGEAQIPWLWSTCQRGVAIYDNLIHVVSSTYGSVQHFMAHATIDVRALTKRNPASTDHGLNLLDPAALGNTANWTQGNYFYPAFPKDPSNPLLGGAFMGVDSVSLAANGNALWVFYSPTFGLETFLGPSGEMTVFQAAKYDPVQGSSDQNEKWDFYTLVDSTGGSLSNKTGAVSARSFGANQFLVAAINSNDQKSIYLGLYHTDGLNTDNNTWKAQASRWVDINNDLIYHAGSGDQVPSPGFANCANHIDIDWFSTPESNAPTYYLAISFTPQNPSENTFPFNTPASVKAFLSLPLIADGSEIDPGWGAAPLWAGYQAANANDSGLMRDPSGRLRTYDYGNVGSQPWLFDSFTNTANPPSAGYLTRMAGPATAVNDTSRPANGAFLVYEEGKTEITIQKSVPNGPPVSIPGDNYPVLEFVTYGTQHCQLNYFGDIRVIRDTATPNQKDADAPVYILGGIIDSPPPIPLVNYTLQDLVAHRADTGTLTYGNKTESEQEISEESKWSVGFETSGEFTEGVGPAWDISVEGGMGSLGRQTKGEEISRVVAVPGAVISEPPYTEIMADADGAVSILSARFHLTAYRFCDTNGIVISDSLGSNPTGMAPSVSSALMTMVDGEPAGSSFEPYCVVPGELESYTAKAINLKMPTLGYTGGSNYFGDVICRNAFVWTLGQDTLPYLEYTWSNGELIGASANVFQSSYQEQSWSFDASLYGGVSGGFGVPEVMAFEAKFMAGVKFSSERAESSSNTNGWGIEMSDPWGPINHPEIPGTVQEYSFRVYFLPVPQNPISSLAPEYWATELRNNLKEDGPLTKDNVDKGSACWRITYVVTDIKYRQPSEHPDYTHDNSLDRESVYANQPSAAIKRRQKKK